MHPGRYLQLRSKIRQLLGWHRRCLLTHRELRHAAVCERMRIYRNNSSLIVVLFEPMCCTLREAAPILDGILDRRLSEIDSAGFAHDGRIAVLLPDYVVDDAKRFANRVAEDCVAEDLLVNYEIVQYPDQSISSLMHNDELDTPADTSTTASMFFSARLPTWKRAIDIVGASIALTLSAPALLVAALLIKMSSNGTIFFTQERTGQAGKPFMIRKLRTMKMGAEQDVHALRSMSDQDGPAFKLKKDPRVFPVGSVLRKLSIDELPQFWNVLMGEMSLVGPRPLPTHETRELTLWQRERLDAKPGITGPWQVSGRNNIPFDTWMRMDVDYVRNTSLLSDLRILLVTIPAVLLCRGAS